MWQWPCQTPGRAARDLFGNSDGRVPGYPGERTFHFGPGRVPKWARPESNFNRAQAGADYYFSPKSNVFRAFKAGKTAFLQIRESNMRNLCLVFAFTLNLAIAADPVVPPDSAKAVPDTSGAAAPVIETLDTARTGAGQPETPAAAPVAGTADTLGSAPASTASAPANTSRPIFKDFPLVAREYLFGAVGQTVAGALGFFIGSAIETAFAGEEDAHKGTLSFTGIRYDNFYGAFWGATTSGFLGSTLAVYFTGQSDEEDGGFAWTLLGTSLAGAGALYTAHLMGVNDEVDWKPFLPLLAIPTAGGVVAFNLSRWFSDRKRESIMGPDAGLHIHPPRLAWAMTPEGERFQIQALNLSF